MRPLNKRTFRLEQSMESYGCNCSCTSCSNPLCWNDCIPLLRPSASNSMTHADAVARTQAPVQSSNMMTVANRNMSDPSLPCNMW